MNRGVDFQVQSGGLCFQKRCRRVYNNTGRTFTCTLVASCACQDVPAASRWLCKAKAGRTELATLERTSDMCISRPSVEKSVRWHIHRGIGGTSHLITYERQHAAQRLQGGAASAQTFPEAGPASASSAAGYATSKTPAIRTSIKSGVKLIKNPYRHFTDPHTLRTLQYQLD